MHSAAIPKQPVSEKLVVEMPEIPKPLGKGSATAAVSAMDTRSRYNTALYQALESRKVGERKGSSTAAAPVTDTSSQSRKLVCRNSELRTVADREKGLSMATELARGMQPLSGMALLQDTEPARKESRSQLLPQSRQSRSPKPRGLAFSLSRHCP